MCRKLLPVNGESESRKSAVIEAPRSQNRETHPAIFAGWGLLNFRAMGSNHGTVLANADDV
jgi:hypothetical protein